MLLQRAITAAILAPLVILLILFASTAVFAAVAAAAFLAALWEWVRLSGLKSVALQGDFAYRRGSGVRSAVDGAPHPCDTHGDWSWRACGGWSPASGCATSRMAPHRHWKTAH